MLRGSDGGRAAAQFVHEGQRRGGNPRRRHAAEDLGHPLDLVSLRRSLVAQRHMEEAEIAHPERIGVEGQPVERVVAKIAARIRRPFEGHAGAAQCRRHGLPWHPAGERLRSVEHRRPCRKRACRIGLSELAAVAGDPFDAQSLGPLVQTEQDDAGRRQGLDQGAQARPARLPLDRQDGGVKRFTVTRVGFEGSHHRFRRIAGRTGEGGKSANEYFHLR
ncbi:hypothetical protein SI859A1_02405 [Aurantimonas manganoxydans SI85-9A1]|uniref:Uncharacterized protein n=1 Tax=Aurantimonas manganoxydans (strain ATCC BAA-1229 / DSM 21871 / SI85-9A1) TaxID=287752 RepID=Q1YLZ2_AURMS|nr:hypothetical protein SI859A1_02405 [Aurantimonas manganoxydans SI85-9A1]